MASRYHRGSALTAASTVWDLKDSLTHMTIKLSSNRGLKCELNPKVTLLEPGILSFLSFSRTNRTQARRVYEDRTLYRVPEDLETLLKILVAILRSRQQN